MSAGGLQVDLTVEQEGFRLAVRFEAEASSLGVFGPSGAGKTTLLEAVAGLKPATGSIRFQGRTWLDTQREVNLPPEMRGVGYVPQEGLLFPHWNVRGNILAGARRRDGEGEDGGGRVVPEEVIRVLALEDLLGRRVTDLSGGERQRVALARALSSGPSLMLMDEPLGSIDRPLRSRILPYLLEVKETFGIPTLFVSHDAAEVEMLCDTVLVLDRGKIRARGRPHQVFASSRAGPALPGDAYENILEGTVEAADGEMARVRLPGGPAVAVTAPPGLRSGARITLGIRAAEIMIALDQARGLSARNLLPGTVKEIARVEGGDLVRVVLGDHPTDVAVMVTDAARRALDLQEGKPVLLVAKARSFHVLAAR